MKQYSHKVNSEDTWQIIQNTRKKAFKRYFAKFGCVYLLSKETFDGHGQVKGGYIGDLHSHLRKILTTDNRVISIANRRNDDSAIGMMASARHLRSEAFVHDIGDVPKREFRLQYELRNPFLVDIQLQLRTEDKRPYWLDNPLSKIPEKCMAWYDGAIFMAYHDSDESYNHYGHAVRDVLEEIFTASDLLYVQSMGPSPIHPDIEIIFISPDSKKQGGVEISPVLRQPTMFKNNIYIPITITENDLENKRKETLYSIFNGFRWVLHEFYEATTVRSDALSKYKALENKLDVVKTSVARLHSVNNWHFLERRKMICLIEKGISEVTLALVDNQSAYRDLAEASEEISKRDVDSNIAVCCVDYLVEQCRDLPGVDYMLINTLLERLDSEIGRYSSNRTQVLAAVMGGAVGAALTLLITWLANSL